MYFYNNGKRINSNGKNSSEATFLTPLKKELEFTKHFVNFDLTSIYERGMDVISAKGYLWFENEDKLVRFNTKTGEYKYIDVQPLNTIWSLYNKKMTCDGENIYFTSFVRDSCIYKLSLETLEVSSFKLDAHYSGYGESIYPYNIDGTIAATLCDENYLWFSYAMPYFTGAQENLVKVDLKTGKANAYKIMDYFGDSTPGTSKISNLIRTRDSILMIKDDKNTDPQYIYQRCIEFNILSETFQEHYFEPHYLPSSYMLLNPLDVFYDGEYLWYFYENAKEIGCYNTKNFSLTVYPIAGNNLGNITTLDPYNAGVQAFQSSVFDGRFLWGIPYRADRILRFDTISKTFEGIDFLNNNSISEMKKISELQREKDGYFTGAVFDGENMWLTSHSAYKSVVKVSSIIEESETPAGAIMHFATPTAPKGWLECDGAEVPRVKYNKLFSAIGTTYGVGDGSSTFNLPDERGLFRRSLDSSKQRDIGRTIGSVQGDAIRKIEGTISTNASIGLTSSVETVGTGALTNEGMPVQPQAWGPIVNISSTGIKFDSSRVVPTADENRPKNIAYLACIKY